MEVVVVAPDAAPSLEVLAAYWREIVGRYHRRAATDVEVERTLAAFPSGHLAPPSGLFLLALDEDGPAGCVGVTWLDGRRGAELGRLFVAARARRTGLGRRLLADAERRARDHGASSVRLEVRADLLEARALYAASGYRPVAAFSDAPYADVWLAKRLG